MKKVAVLGSTGNIGRCALKVIQKLRGFKVNSLAAHSNWRLLKKQIENFCPSQAVVVDERAFKLLKKHLRNSKTKIMCGEASITRIAREPGLDIVLCAISGSAGLTASIQALKNGKTLALANKESIVMAGELLIRYSRENNARIIPVDSEHSAIFQALHSGKKEQVRRVILTASGGPFASHKKSFRYITPEDALKHPVWKMGSKISVDSATLMNKALEIIEAKYLFDLKWNQIKILIHPQSIMHSMVEFQDGSCIAQLSVPDMRIPIQYALTYPERMNNMQVRSLDLAQVKLLTFERPDTRRFPSLRFGYEAAKKGGTLPTVISVADEIAVENFLKGRIGFNEIFDLIEYVMQSHKIKKDPSLNQIFKAAQWAREKASEFIRSRL
jgi:1-deoxy-D-xylulose-5-phosphate reductoisomerase